MARYQKLMDACREEGKIMYMDMDCPCADCLDSRKEGDGKGNEDRKAEIRAEEKRVIERETQTVETEKKMYKEQENMWSKRLEAEAGPGADRGVVDYKNQEVKPIGKVPLSKMTWKGEGSTKLAKEKWEDLKGKAKEGVLKGKGSGEAMNMGKGIERKIEERRDRADESDGDDEEDGDDDESEESEYIGSNEAEYGGEDDSDWYDSSEEEGGWTPGL